MNPFKMKTHKANTIAAYQRIFSSPEGERVLLDLVKVARLDIPTFAAGDPHETSYREGERSIVLRIIKTINTDPAYVLELLAGQSEE